ncbi:MAG: hypothetical protein MJZ29_04060 [Bacteroidaceae bacterium]|nr:hypothetical protein [Bacteroidaceae bacterium]
MMRNIHTYLYTLAFAAAMLFTACAEVDLCEDSHEGNLPAVKYSFDWGKYKADAPEGMYTMAHRIINDWKRVDMVSASEESDTFKVRPGEYKFLALPTKHNAFDLRAMAASLAQPENYANENDRYDEVDRVQDKSISYMLYSRQQILSLSDEEATSEDKIARYIHPYAEPFFFDSVSVVQVKNDVQHVRFAPKSITQCIDVQFYIRANTTHTIDSVHAELSGIPLAMEIGSRFVSKETASVLMKPSLSEARLDLEDEDRTLDVIQCNSRINVPTVLSSESDSENTSPGLLTVTVYTSEDTPEGKKVYCTVITRNLYYILEQAKLCEFTDDLEHIVRNGETGKIEVNTPFTIGK